MTGAAHEALEGAAAVLVSDYGRGVAARRDVRAAMGALRPGVPVVWDPHPRGAEPIPGVRLATPNRREVTALVHDGDGGDGGDERSDVAVLSEGAHQLLERWRLGALAVTLGARGALLVAPGGPPLAVPAPAARGDDPCGAGDRFAAAAARALLHGALVSEAVIEAVGVASAFVDAGGAAALGRDAAHTAPSGAPHDARALSARMRAGGGTVVATGGCFDLLHAGHVGMLEAARRLGDCLIVCLNSDDSLRRIKGHERPLQRQEDRAAVLEALGCVDAVAIFEEDTPVRLLEQLRPHVFAKGADYALGALPEARALAAWGGQAVVVPYLPGRSTTRLVDLAHEQRSRAHRRETP